MRKIDTRLDDRLTEEGLPIIEEITLRKIYLSWAKQSKKDGFEFLMGQMENEIGKENNLVLSYLNYVSALFPEENSPLLEHAILGLYQLLKSQAVKNRIEDYESLTNHKSENFK